MVGILISISMMNVMLSWVENEKKFYNLWACSLNLSLREITDQLDGTQWAMLQNPGPTMNPNM